MIHHRIWQRSNDLQTNFHEPIIEVYHGHKQKRPEFKSQTMGSDERGTLKDSMKCSVKEPSQQYDGHTISTVPYKTAEQVDEYMIERGQICNIEVRDAGMVREEDDTLGYNLIADIDQQ